MRFRLYREHGALNSHPIFNAFEEGLKKHGHSVVTDGEYFPVIWSVLWHGRMLANKNIYHRCRSLNKPVVIIEVGNLLRGTTWRISLDHINGHGFFGNYENLDPTRSKKLGVFLKPYKEKRKDEILIACQHEHSLQWEGQPSMSRWASNVVDHIRQFSDRKIVVRPHPRSNFEIPTKDIIFDRPAKVPNTYDDFNIDYNYHCVVNFNSGPAVKAAIEGTPIICDSSSLAYPVSDKFENIENLSLPDRDDWFLKLCHTEWLVDEIANGTALERILNFLEEKI